MPENQDILEKKSEPDKDVIVYLTMPYIFKGDTYPILREGYKLEHLPKEVLNFRHKKIVGDKETLKKFIAEQARIEKLKDRDFRADTAIADIENEKLKQEMASLTEQNASLQGQLAEVLAIVKTLQGKSTAEPAEATKEKTTTAKTAKK